MRLSPRAVALLFFALITLLAGTAAVDAQALEPGWLAGTWKASTPNSANPNWMNQHELTVKSDGTFQRKLQPPSVNANPINQSGTYKVESDAVIMEGLLQSASPQINGTVAVITLKRNGERLDGTVVSAWNNLTTPVSFSRVK